MKKITAILLLAAMLTGCGMDESVRPETSVSESESSEITEAPTEEETEAPTESPGLETESPAEEELSETSEEETEAEAPTEEEQPEENSPVSFKEAYKTVLEEACQVYEGQETGGSVTFTLYNVCGDETPELIVKTGTCEADYVIDFYTLTEDGTAVKLCDPIGGGHTSFGRNTETDNFSLLYGHMGYGYAFQLVYEQGQMISAGNEFETDFLDSEEYYEKVAAQGYELIDFEEVFYSGQQTVSWLYRRGQDGRLESEPLEFAGKDFSFIDLW
ncbi:MAG: hypothetical protein IJ071_04510 [Ruminococcus sp.]|nr:hypothetical protein [Ruminococcus sp.]